MPELYLPPTNTASSSLQDLAAEKALLGLLLRRNSFIHDITNISLAAEAFFDPKHQIIFTCMLELFGQALDVNEITVQDQLKGKGVVDYQSFAYLAGLLDDAPFSGSVLPLAKIVQRHYLARELRKLCNDVVIKIDQPEADVEQLLVQIENATTRLAAQSTRPKYTKISAVLQETLEKINQQIEQGVPSGLDCGFENLNAKLAGFQDSDLIIIAGRPGMGKTAFGLNVARFISQKQPVLFFSLEMSAIQLALRLISGAAEVELQKITTGQKKNEQEYSKIINAINNLSKLPIYINDTASLSTHELLATARQLNQSLPGHGLGMVVVDYLQLLRCSSNRPSREQEISEVSRTLKALAKELQIPVVALAQLNREPESRTNKRPFLSDLRESGSLEQDADIVMFLYRDEIYNEDTPEPGIAEVIISKHRNGPTGSVKLGFVGQFTKFMNLTNQEEILPTIEID